MKRVLYIFLIVFVNNLIQSQNIKEIYDKLDLVHKTNGVIGMNLKNMANGDYSGKNYAADRVYNTTIDLNKYLGSTIVASNNLIRNNPRFRTQGETIKKKLFYALDWAKEIKHWSDKFTETSSGTKRKFHYYEIAKHYDNINRVCREIANILEEIRLDINKQRSLANNKTSKKSSKKSSIRVSNSNKKDAYDVGNEILKNNRDNDNSYANEFNKEIEKQKKKKKVTNNSSVKKSNSLSSISSNQLVTSINNLLRSHTLRSVENSMVSKLLVKNSDLHFEYNNSFRIQLNPQKINEFKLRKAKHPKKNTEVFMVVINSKSNLNSFPVKQIANEKLLESVSSWYWVFYNLDKAKEYFFKLRELAQRLNKKKTK